MIKRKRPLSIALIGLLCVISLSQVPACAQSGERRSVRSQPSTADASDMQARNQRAGQEHLSAKTHEIENLVIEMVNHERGKRKLRRLERDAQLTNLAREHSRDMARNGFFSHTNGRGEDPTARARKKGIEVAKKHGATLKVGIAENIGMIPIGNVRGYGPVKSAEDVARAMMKDWLESSSHRSNILNPDHEVIGVGVAEDGRGRYYLTQDFR